MELFPANPNPRSSVMSSEQRRAVDFKETDAMSYDAHVEDFDRFSSALTKPFARRMIAMANISAGQRVLDIGTGTGVLALEAAKAVGNEGQCIGIDLSEKMLASAKASARQTNLTERTEFKVMDAESLEFKPASFDAVVSLFALLHFPNPSNALKEMFRVLKPGGTLVVAVGSPPSWFSWQGVIHAANLIPQLVARLRGLELVAPQFLNQLVQECIPAQDEPEVSSLAQAGRNRSRIVPRLIRNAGFVNLRQCWEGRQTVIETPADFWRIQRTFSSIARKRLNRATPDQVAGVRAKFDELCHKVLSRGGRLIYPVGAFFVAAERSSQTR